jgi:hypothetical protein
MEIKSQFHSLSSPATMAKRDLGILFGAAQIARSCFVSVFTPRIGKLRSVRLQRILDLAPSAATVELGMLRYSRGYECFLEEFYRQTRFISGCQTARFRDMIDHLFSEVQAQISHWKREHWNHVERPKRLPTRG